MPALTFKITTRCFITSKPLSSKRMMFCGTVQQAQPVKLLRPTTLPKLEGDPVPSPLRVPGNADHTRTERKMSHLPPEGLVLVATPSVSL